MAAYTAAKAASDAAAMATTSADAEMHQAEAERQQGLAEAELVTATNYAGIVSSTQRQIAADKLEADKLDGGADGGHELRLMRRRRRPIARRRL